MNIFGLHFNNHHININELDLGVIGHK